jgi:3-(methylthio)propanoyl-CoA dehydrogenase
MAVSVPYLKLCGYVIGGWLLGKSAAIAAGKLSGTEREFYSAKLRTAVFYAAQVLPVAAALARVVQAGGTSVTATDAALL